MLTHAHPCYSNCAHVFKDSNFTNNIAPIPTQNPWAPNVELWCVPILQEVGVDRKEYCPFKAALS